MLFFCFLVEFPIVSSSSSCIYLCWCVRDTDIWNLRFNVDSTNLGSCTWQTLADLSTSKRWLRHCIHIKYVSAAGIEPATSSTAVPRISRCATVTMSNILYYIKSYSGKFFMLILLCCILFSVLLVSAIFFDKMFLRYFMRYRLEIAKKFYNGYPQLYVEFFDNYLLFKCQSLLIFCISLKLLGNVYLRL